MIVKILFSVFLFVITSNASEIETNTPYFDYVFSLKNEENSNQDFNACDNTTHLTITLKENSLSEVSLEEIKEFHQINKFTTLNNILTIAKNNKFAMMIIELLIPIITFVIIPVCFLSICLY